MIQKITRSLRCVLVLSIIGSGYMLLSSLLSALFLPAMAQFLEAGSVAMPEEFQVAMEMLLHTPRSFFALSALLYALSLTGVILMWNLRPNGFHCYTLAQILLLILPVLFLGKDRLALGDIMLTALFVGYYYFTLKQIRQLQECEEAEPDQPDQPDQPDRIQDDGDDSDVE